jgi:Zn-dependent peptidase ImmA (M78 family)
LIGRRLKLARRAGGLSLRALQQRIDHLVTAQAIGKYERDESMPSSGVLLALARALGVSAEYLVGDGDLVLEGIDFRKRAFARRKEQARVQATLLHSLERYLTVEQVLGLPTDRWTPPRGSPFLLKTLDDAEAAAQAVRDAWDLGTDPLPNFIDLLEERGVKVIATDLPGIAGVTARARRPGKEPVPVIVINASEWGERQRFTLAHELGHLVLQAARDLDAERAADRFAGALLMPAAGLYEVAGRHRHSVSQGELLEIKKLFGVSVQAVAFRCRDLGIIPEAVFRALFQQFSRAGWRTPPYREPFAIPPARPTRFERLCYRALAEGAVSEPKAAELLGLSAKDLRARMAGRMLN